MKVTLNDISSMSSYCTNISHFLIISVHKIWYIHFAYRVKYALIFGGATAFTSAQFEKANGHSNEFYGWGGEDDDLAKRFVET